MTNNDNGRDARSRANRRLRNLTIGTAVFGVMATGSLSALAAASYHGATDTSTAAAVTANGASTTSAATSTTTAGATTTTAAPVVVTAAGSGHATTGGS